MRYPKSQEDVEIGDATISATMQASQVSSPDNRARRRTIPVMRPPGAVREEQFLAGCTRCEACIQACPHGAIFHAPLQLREAAGTPTIDAQRQPCLMCADFPCIAACEPGVLSPRVPVLMGTARITEQTCLAYQDSMSCRVCVESCPVPRAIVEIDGRPRIDETACTGCGVCRHVCPAPENAVLLMPTFLRPLPDTKVQPHDG